MNIELENGQVLSSGQSWDSGTFKNFQLSIGDKDCYSYYPLNWTLTKDQINELEMLMLAKAYQMISEGG